MVLKATLFGLKEDFYFLPDFPFYLADSPNETIYKPKFLLQKKAVFEMKNHQHSSVAFNNICLIRIYLFHFFTCMYFSIIIYLKDSVLSS